MVETHSLVAWGARPTCPLAQRLEAHPRCWTPFDQLAKHYLNIGLCDLLAKRLLPQVFSDKHNEVITRIGVGEETQTVLVDDMRQRIRVAERRIRWGRAAAIVWPGSSGHDGTVIET